MLIIDNYRIIKMDKYNLTFEEYKEVEKKKQRVMEWVRVGGYYGSLDSCLKALKDYIIEDLIENNNLYINELKDKINALNEAYIRCKLNGMEEQNG